MSPVTQTTAIAKAFTAAANLVVTYLKTREMAWRRKRDKRQVKAIEAAEWVFLNWDLDFIDKHLMLNDKTDKDWQQMKKKYFHYKRRFFKYNN